MMDLFFHLCLGGLGLAVCAGLIRAAVGPTVIDRMIAFDLVAVAGVGAIAVISVMRGTTDFLELILVYSMLGFVGTLALTRYLETTMARRRPAERERGGDDD